MKEEFIKPELSKKSKYYIPKERTYELRHFCLQYPSWRREVFDLESQIGSNWLDRINSDHKENDPTYEKACRIYQLNEYMLMVKKAAFKSDPEIGNYIFDAVISGHSFDYMQMHYQMPCGHTMFYDRLRKFFWILDKYR